MTVNKKTTRQAAGLFAGLLLALVSPAVYAQSATAPAMYNVEEVVVQVVHFGNDKTAQNCDLAQQDLGAALIKTLTDKGVPAVSTTDAMPPMYGNARINLIPEIYSLDDEGLDCTSWISLRAETHNSVHVPPVDVARNVTVLYWHEGTLLSSSQSTHARTVSDALQKLGRHLAEQYKLDQPQAKPAQ